MLVGFGDGGDLASCAAVYLRSKRLELGPDGETHDVRLVAGKAHITPSSKADGQLRRSTPRTEMRGAVLLTRLITSISGSLPYKQVQTFLALDSECTISSLEAQDRILGIWFTNRVAEVTDHMDSWHRQDVVVPLVHHWLGEDNPADLGMKGRATLQDIGPGSKWQ